MRKMRATAFELREVPGVQAPPPSISLETSSRLMVAFPDWKGLSSVRKSMQWHSLRSRIGTHGQFQKPFFTSASLSS